MKKRKQPAPPSSGTVGKRSGHCGTASPVHRSPSAAKARGRGNRAGGGGDGGLDVRGLLRLAAVAVSAAADAAEEDEETDADDVATTGSSSSTDEDGAADCISVVVEEDEDGVVGAGRSTSRAGAKRGRSIGRDRTPAEEAFSRDRSGSSHVSTKSTRGDAGRSESRDRSVSAGRGEGFRDARQKLRAMKLAKVNRARMGRAAKFGKQGEGDRVVSNMMPKHLFSGKMNTKGKRDRR